jgi:hypothetical protein
LIALPPSPVATKPNRISRNPTNDAEQSRITGRDGTTHEVSRMNPPLSDQAAQALALLASEWFKTARRLSRLTQETSPARLERERAQLAYSQSRVKVALAEHGLRLITHDGVEFSPQIPAEPVNPEDFDTDEGLIVRETVEPTVIHDGRVIARGLVVLARGE